MIRGRKSYCYLLVAEQRRDADTWGVHLLDAAERGLRPDYTIADAGQHGCSTLEDLIVQAHANARQVWLARH